MTNRIKNPDWEALSSYLDNQLSPKDRARLEARFKQEPEMQQALEELRRTRVVLRSQRPMRAPRNFTLTPAMAGVRRAGRPLYAGPYNLLRLASALATIFFVLITVGDLAAQRFAPAPRTVTVAEQMREPIFGMGGGGGGGPITAVTEEAAAEEAIEPETSEAAPDDMTLMVTPVGTGVADAETLKRGDIPPGEAPMANAVEPGQAGGMYEPEPGLPRLPGILIRTLQGMLLVLAVGAGVAALYLRRNAA